jgi:site-specific recombinase XerD
MDHNGFRVTRKGGKVAVLYFSNDVKSTLLSYLEQRETILPVTGHESALFLSLQKKRITARAVENLVEKYAGIAVPLKKITPHKLRSTYGTALYKVP